MADSNLDSASHIQTSVSKRSPMSKLRNTRSESSGPGSTTAILTTPQSGTTLNHLMAENGGDSSILLWRDFLVNLIRSRAYVKLPRGLQTIETCGEIRAESSARYDPARSYWKMSQASWSLGMDDRLMPDEFVATWPRSALISGLMLFPRPQRERRINAIAGGASVWPTPTVSDTEGGAVQNVELENGSFSRKNAKGVRWGVKLRHAVESRLWPTPTARDYKDGSAESSKNVPTNGLLGRTIHEGQNEPKASLNPDWVEWLMGLPCSWTDVNPMPENAYDDWFEEMSAGHWWTHEHGIPRVEIKIPNRVNRLKALGNGIVPAALARALNYGS